MGRPKFRITVDNLIDAANYLDGRLGCLTFVPMGSSIEDARKLMNEIVLSPKSERSVARLQAWCDTNLDGRHRRLLPTALRKRRQRKKNSDFRVITVSRSSYDLLCKLARRDRVTLDCALEKSAKKALKLRPSRDYNSE